MRRIRHTPRVLLMASSGLGKTHGGKVTAQARLVEDPDERKRAEQALRRKYAVVYRAWFGGWGVVARLKRKPRGIPVYLAISPI